MLLDFPCPGLEATTSLQRPSFEAMQDLLSEVIERALWPGVPRSNASAGSHTVMAGQESIVQSKLPRNILRVPVALHAETLLRSLRQRTFPTSDTVLSQLRSILDERAVFRPWQSVLCLFSISDIISIIGFSVLTMGYGFTALTPVITEQFTWMATPLNEYLERLLFVFCLGALLHVMTLLSLIDVDPPHSFMRFFDEVVLGPDGQPASRLRQFARWIIASIPICIALLAVVQGHRGNGISVLALALLMLSWLVIPLFKPNRSLPDRVAGTYLVPR